MSLTGAAHHRVLPPGSSARLVGDNTHQVEPHSLRVTSHESVIHAPVDTSGALIIPTQYLYN